MTSRKIGDLPVIGLPESENFILPVFSGIGLDGRPVPIAKTTISELAGRIAEAVCRDGSVFMQVSESGIRFLGKDDACEQPR